MTNRGWRTGVKVGNGSGISAGADPNASLDVGGYYVVSKDHDARGPFATHQDAVNDMRPTKGETIEERAARSSSKARDPRLDLLKEARRRIRDIKIKDEHAYALGLAIGVLYVMRDEIRASEFTSPERSKP